MPENMRAYLDFLSETAYLAGRLTLGYFQTGIQADFKADHSPVTQADRKAEELIRARIEQRYPTHAIVGEEFGLKESADASHRWFIDPIDGTKSFVRGVPLYGVLIGLEIEGRVAAGAAYYPGTDEMLAAADGEGCWWNGRRAHVSAVSNLSEAWITCTDVGSFHTTGRWDAWERLLRSAYFRAGWGDAYGYLLIATGRAEVMLDPIMHEWDCGPFPPIFREAGGYFGDWQGRESIYAGEALATNAALKEETIRVLAGK
jgi:histidinol-phosphatase